ncbi:MAG: hypothetical protein LCH26_05130 [Proteobacteria bacterium]|nr:hypothetical protein [Pseudomonadota bacterium]
MTHPRIILPLILLHGAAFGHAGAPALTKSLFFDDTHVGAVKDARRAHEKEATSPETTRYHLSGILYTSPGHWKLWINGKQYAPKAFPELRVISVSPRRASFILRLKDRDVPFVLGVNEAFQAPS